MAKNMFHASIHWEKDVIFLGLAAGRIARSSPVVASCTVSDLLVSGSEPPANMALGNNEENSMNSPRIIRSLIRGGTGGNDDCMVGDCIRVGSGTDWTVVGGICIGTGLEL